MVNQLKWKKNVYTAFSDNCDDFHFAPKWASVKKCVSKFQLDPMKVTYPGLNGIKKITLHILQI